MINILFCQQGYHFHFLDEHNVLVQRELDKSVSRLIDIGGPSRAYPVTPPGIRVRTTAVRLVKHLVDLST
jgi:hypothetical protein